MLSQLHTPPQNQPNSLHRRGLWFILTLALILLLAAGLRFYNLSGPSLWADEGNSVALARRSFIEIAQHTAFDIHPPLYYWLLKIWSALFGFSQVSLRSLSAVLGVGVVYLTGLLGTRWFGPRLGLLAAFIAALSPLQIYYSQEARMYMLLTCLSSLTVLLAAWLWQKEGKPHARMGKPGETGDRNNFWLASPVGIAYILTVTAGLYTHYAYPVILLAVNLAALFWLTFQRSNVPTFQHFNRHSPFANWLLLQLIPLILYLPWLPTAWRQITTWPTEPHSASLWDIWQTIAVTLLFGLSWPYHTGLIAVIIIGLTLILTFNLQRSIFSPTLFPNSVWERDWGTFNLLFLWFVLPVSLTAIVFSPAFLKFLLVAAPPLAVLIALAIVIITHHASRLTPHASRIVSQASRIPFDFIPTLVGSLLLVALSAASLISLYHYYYNPVFARDNYRAIAGFIQAVGKPNDAVILHAEGQQDVFNYYYADSPAPTAPVYPLPRRRPLDEAATLAELQTIASQAHKVYAVFWATQQADPAGLIETWLDTHLLKAADQWYGHIRLATYITPQVVAGQAITPVNFGLGEHIQLVGQAFPATGLKPGDILPLILLWQTDAPLPTDGNYTLFIQVLDSANHLVGQRDALLTPPAAEWPVNQPIPTGYGLLIEPGTPPGKYRLIAGLYHSATGQRLPASDGQDFVPLGEIEVIRPARPLPLAAYQIQTPLNESIFGVDLLGYDLYKLGHRSTPDMPLHPGDAVQLVTYWQARQPVQPVQDRLSIQVVTLTGAKTPVTATFPLAGLDYPIQQWPPGEIVRAQYTLPLNNLPPGTYRLALTLSEGESVTPQQVTVLTKSFRVE